jgi:hypothetical protein
MLPGSDLREFFVSTAVLMDCSLPLPQKSASRTLAATPHEDWPTFRLTHSLRGRVSHWPLHASGTLFVRSGTNNLDIKALAPIIPGRGT